MQSMYAQTDRSLLAQLCADTVCSIGCSDYAGQFSKLAYYPVTKGVTVQRPRSTLAGWFANLHP